MTITQKPIKRFVVNGDVSDPSRGDTPRFIIHLCNNEGIMGSGVAKAICDRYPINKKEYITFCKSVGMEKSLGSIIPVKINDELTIVNLIGQNGTNLRDRVWKDCVDYQALQLCFDKLHALVSQTNGSIHTPLMGSQRAKGKTWKILGMLRTTFEDTDNIIYVYIHGKRQ